MGRWAQAQRSGGGSKAPTFLARIAVATAVGDDVAAIGYNQVIHADALVPADFNSDPLGALGLSIVQTAVNEIQVTFADTIEGGQAVGYTGATPGFKTPDSVDYS